MQSEVKLVQSCIALAEMILILSRRKYVLSPEEKTLADAQKSPFKMKLSRNLHWCHKVSYVDCVMLLVFFRSLFFGDYMVPDSAERIYDEVTDITLLTQQMEGYVNIYYSLCCFFCRESVLITRNYVKKPS